MRRNRLTLYRPCTATFTLKTLKLDARETYEAKKLPGLALFTGAGATSFVRHQVLKQNALNLARISIRGDLPEADFRGVREISFVRLQTCNPGITSGCPSSGSYRADASK
jgi:hypothetical protein